jgi:hypothetical protein
MQHRQQDSDGRLTRRPRRAYAALLTNHGSHESEILFPQDSKTSRQLKKNRSQNVCDSGARTRGGRKQKRTHQGQLSRRVHNEFATLAMKPLPTVMIATPAKTLSFFFTSLILQAKPSKSESTISPRRWDSGSIHSLFHFHIA